METLNFILILILMLILVLIFVVVNLLIQFYFENRNFIKKTNYLNEVLVQLHKNKSVKLDQIKLSDELDKKLKKSTNTLNSVVFELNTEMFKMLSNNNLI
jgi:predicted Holliday junction resolvase-like endonuclease